MGIGGCRRSHTPDVREVLSASSRWRPCRVFTASAPAHVEPPVGDRGPPVSTICRSRQRASSAPSECRGIHDRRRLDQRHDQTCCNRPGRCGSGRGGVVEVRSVASGGDRDRLLGRLHTSRSCQRQRRAVARTGLQAGRRAPSAPAVARSRWYRWRGLRFVSGGGIGQTELPPGDLARTDPDESVLRGGMPRVER